MRNPRFPGAGWIGLVAVALAACTAIVPQTPLPSPVPSLTPEPPTSTPEPLAARVGDTPIRLAEFELEVARFEAGQASIGIDLATQGDYRMQIMQAMIDEQLLALGAGAQGIVVGQADVTRKIENLTSEIGGPQAMKKWLGESGYDDESFRAALSIEMQANDMIARILEGLPQAVEQVRVRHVLVATREQAELLREQIAAGADLGEVALSYSLDLTTRYAGGDLGWFPRGYLTVPELEEACFTLQPGVLSEVIRTALGYHVIEVLEREVRPLLPDAERVLQQRAVEQWLAAARQATPIEVYVTP